MEKEKNIDFSIVIPVYCNQGSLKNLYQILRQEVLFKNESKTYEIIFIDDGSPDDSLKELMAIKAQNPKCVKVIKFTRNFGQVSAITAGYEHARGKYIINISADLQDPPQLINQMIKSHNEENYDIVICNREAREESFFKRSTSKIFYTLIRKLSFENMPVGGFDFLLISDRVKKTILKKKEANPFWQGQILWTGFNIKFIPYTRVKREVGRSKWTFPKKIKYLIDGVMAYSYFPLRLMSALGLIISLSGFLYAFLIMLFRIFGKIPIKGWAPLMVIILILSGIQMLMTGIIGEYLWRTLDQVRNRELYIIEEIYD